MASPQAPDKLASNLKINVYDHDPDDTDPDHVEWVDMKGYENFMAILFRSVGSGDIDEFSIDANAESDGGGTDVEIETHALGSSVDAVGDYIILECTAEQIAQEGADNGEDLRYVSATVEQATAGDECVVVYIRKPLRPQDGLTADTIS